MMTPGGTDLTLQVWIMRIVYDSFIIILIIIFIIILIIYFFLFFSCL